uniref:Chitinase A n=1 Tax=Siphoviridae sp. ctCCv12 TaxID=2826191 RepID=A0A8S5N6V3_9CAUD|nr:MAG TPA: Chitinase A [Siphoviridae sp. ctCCv12]
MTRYQAQIGVPSENGWPMCSSAACVSETVVPAARAVPLRAGDVATILNAWLILYNRLVEPITSQVWGWSADNDVWNSNHMSGTAVDIGAPKYPWGQRTMPPATKAKVRTLLAKFEGVVFWGADWDYPDEMHYQIGLPPSDPRVHAFAERLNNGYLGAYPADDAPSAPKGNPMNDDDLYLRDLKAQMTGAPGLGAYPGWPQLGGRTVVDALAAIGAKLEIPGFADLKAQAK